jgi:signal transduction histidine kinase/CheY-like chemotaxis protein
MDMPVALVRRLYQSMREREKPLCLLIGADRRLISRWGDSAYYGFGRLTVGEDCVQRLDFLVGLELNEPICLPFVATPNGHAAHVELVPAKDELNVIFVDATEEQRRQQVVQQKANELSLLNYRQKRLMEELQVAQAELNLKRREAEEANLLKSRFIASMSHEFRTPLTSILGYVQLLQGHKTQMSVVRGYARAIERGAHHLLALINNVLDQAQIEVDRVVIRPTETDLRALLEDLSIVFAPLAAEKSLGFTVQEVAPIPDYLELDGLHLRQVLINLIGNAIKFTDEGNVTVEVGWQDDHLSFAVRDTGPGIPADAQDRVFVPFQQLDGGSPGAGLGLAISRHLIERMGGHLVLESIPGEGSRFAFQTPAAAMQRSQEGTSATAALVSGLSASEKQKRVLMAEDSEALVQLSRLFFEDFGYRLTTVNNGDAAVKVALRDQPDLVLMDMNMPVLDGYTAAKRLRSAGFQAPVIAMSASSSERDRQRALAVGCNDFILKPFNMVELLAVVSKLFDDDKAH